LPSLVGRHHPLTRKLSLPIYLLVCWTHPCPLPIEENTLPVFAMSHAAPDGATSDEDPLDAVFKLCAAVLVPPLLVVLPNPAMPPSRDASGQTAPTQGEAGPDDEAGQSEPETLSSRSSSCHHRPLTTMLLRGRGASSNPSKDMTSTWPQWLWATCWACQPSQALCSVPISCFLF
jgi:hypothetical protein